jgi:thiamine-phosphate diphosphorylase
VTHTGFPNSHKNFPTVPLSPDSFSTPSFLRMRPSQSSSSSTNDNAAPLGKILPIVDTIDLLENVISTGGVTDIQLRFKDTTDHATILDRIRQAQTLCQQHGVHLWINDYWQPAVEAGGCFGIHLGQEDLASCIASGGLESIRSAGLAFGISTHSYSELSAALGVNPSYISLGPVFRTSSKDVKFDPQGLQTVKQWRMLIPPEVPLVAIGGIGDERVAGVVRGAGADCVAVIGAVTQVKDVKAAVDKLNEAMS